MRDGRALGIELLLKQLWLGLSAYRLFPESVDHPAFVAAVERIDAAARAALASGPVDVGIRGDRFLREGLELGDDDHLRRLALACFERRIERLTVLAVPDAHHLEAFYGVLTRDLEDLDADGGVDEVLRGLGVTWVQLSRVGPGLVAGADHPAGDVEPRAGGVRAPEAGRLTAELLLEDLHGAPRDQAETLLFRLKEMLAEAPPAPARSIDVRSTVHGIVADLPPDMRRSLVELLVDRVAVDPVAQRLISTMSTAELARALVDLGRDGRRDPAELARALAQAGVRHPDVVDLTAALESGQEDAGTIMVGLEQLGIDTAGIGGQVSGSSVTDVIANYLGATENDDARAIQAAFAGHEGQLRSETILALGDYLVLESDLERTGEALDLWAEELREALRARDVHKARSLAGAVREALLSSGEDRRELFEAYARHVLDGDLAAELVGADADESGAVVADLLAPFGEIGVEAVLDLLADEEDRAQRAKLLGVARRTVGDRVAPLTTRLSDPRWYVVRNAVILLGATGRIDALPSIERLAQHPSAAVRREVPAALAAAAAVEAVPAIMRLARGDDPEVRGRSVAALGTLVGPEAADSLVQIAMTSEDRPLRLRALEELATRPDGPPRLQELASGAARPRLPRGLRRRARSLSRGGGAS